VGFRVIDPDGRPIVFDARASAHLMRGRPQMLRHIDAIESAVRRPDLRLDDPRPLREQFYRRDLDPGRWLRVVVDFSEVPGFVVTAFVQNNDPQGAR
jgi:hypothetical protein